MIYESLGITPIKPDQPAGVDVRSLPEYEVLSNELDKANNLTATTGINWDKVVDPASTLLATHGKDFQVACYLAAALTQVQKLHGFSMGLKILGDLVQNFWDNMFPPVARIRGRRNALEWWLERCTVALEALSSDPILIDDLKLMKERLAHLDRLLREKDPEGPSLNRISSILDGFSVIEPDKPAEEAQSADAPADAASTNGKTPSVQVAAIEGAIEDVGEALKVALANIARIAEHLREMEILNPLGCRLNRIACWSRIEQLPPNTTGKTMVPCPAPHIRDAFKTVRAGAEPEAVVLFAETRLSQMPFWLDLNRLAAEALTKMGDRGAPALRTVQAETAKFLQRIPELETASFVDGSRFADFDTTTWLGEINQGGGGKGSSGGGEDPLGDAGREAQELLGQGRLFEAVDKLEAAGRSSGSGRVRFLARMHLCESLRDGNRDLRPYLAQLMNDVELHHLETWDPLLAVQALTLVYRFMPNAKPVAGMGLPDREEILHRIAQIDFGRALRISSE
jgi:type VI secretion system protein VasJ